MPTLRQLFFELNKKNPEIFVKEVVFSLFSDVFDLSRNDITLCFDYEFETNDKYNDYVVRLSNGEPIQYVLGYTYFLSNKMYVNKDVLIPRQETEQLVLSTATLIKDNFKDKVEVLDICSGSGCIGISLAKLVDANITMSDISSKANEVAKNNAILNKTKIDIYCSDMFKDLPHKKYDVIISNPPYIRNKNTVDVSTLKHEPHLALFAEPCTKYYEEIFKQKDVCLNKHFLLAFEIGEDMENELSDLVKKYFPNTKYYFEKDICDKTRFLYIIN